MAEQIIWMIIINCPKFRPAYEVIISKKFKEFGSSEPSLSGVVKFSGIHPGIKTLAHFQDFTY
jgi:hypothetical protein